MIRLAIRDLTLESDILTSAHMSNGLNGFELWLAKNFYMTAQEREKVVSKLGCDKIVEFVAPSKTGVRKYELTVMIEEEADARA